MNGPQPTPTRHPGGRTCRGIAAVLLLLFTAFTAGLGAAMLSILV